MASNRSLVVVTAVCLAALTVGAAVAFAQPVPPPAAADVVAQTQARLLAKRAAQADAYRNLAEQVKGLKITSSTYVRDFVAESDEIRTSVSTFLRGAQVADVRYMADDSCQLTMDLPLRVIETELTRTYQAHYKGSKYKISDFQDLHITNKVEKITVIGNGAPREVLVEEYDDQGRAIVRPGGPPPIPAAWQGIPAQARFMAKRAAQADAYRNLAEQIMGFRIRSDTYVRDFVAESDQIQTDLNTFLRGAKVAEVRYLRDLSAEVDVKIALQTVITELTREYEAHYKGSKFKARDFEDIKTTVKVEWVTATGVGVPPPKYLPQPPAGVAQAPAPGWAANVARANGNGVRPATAESDAQGKLMALLAAKLDAMRNLSEQVYGLQIDSRTTVRDFITQNDQIRTEVNNYLTGVRTVSESYNAATGEATVTVEAPLEQLWNIVYRYRSQTRVESGPGGATVESRETIEVRP